MIKNQSVLYCQLHKKDKIVFLTLPNKMPDETLRRFWTLLLDFVGRRKINTDQATRLPYFNRVSKILWQKSVVTHAPPDICHVVLKQ